MNNNYEIKDGVIYFNSEIIAQGYSEKEAKKVEEYRKVLQLKKKGLFGHKISKLLGIPEGRVNAWIIENKKPHPVRAMELAMKKGWLPINTNSKRFETILEIFAWVYGDGHLHKDGYVALFGQRKDLEKIHNKIVENLKLECGMSKSSGTFKDNGETYSLYLKKGCRKFGKLLMVLGAPVGKKVYNYFLIPKWILESSLDVKRRFLEVFFSNEITVRKIESKGYVPNFEVRIDKCKEKLDNCLLFMSQIGNILKEFDMKASLKVRNNERGTCTLSLVITKDLINLYKFYKNFNLIYSCKKQESLEKIGITVKKKLLKHLQDVKDYKVAMKLREQGFGRRRLAEKLNLNTWLIDGWFRRNNKPIFYEREKELENLLKSG